jgi:hypothetical protein
MKLLAGLFGWSPDPSLEMIGVYLLFLVRWGSHSLHKRAACRESSRAQPLYLSPFG